LVGAGRGAGYLEHVGSLGRAVHRVVPAHAAAGGDDALVPRGVVVDGRHDVVEDPVLVCRVAPGALRGRQRVLGPALAVEGVDAVELDPARLDEVAHRV